MKTLELTKTSEHYAEVNVNVLSILPINFANCIRRAKVYEILERNNLDIRTSKNEAQISIIIPLSEWELFERESNLFYKQKNMFKPKNPQTSMLWDVKKELNNI